MLVIPASSGNTSWQIQLMKHFQTAVVHATPSYLLHLKVPEVSTNYLIQVEKRDRPGGLHDLLEILAAHQINVLDAYGFVVAPGRQAIWCMAVADLAEATRLVAEQGLRVLEDRDVYPL